MSYTKYVICGIFLLTGVLSIYAQGVADVLRLSDLKYAGSARSVGTGMSMSAIGADQGVLSLNPAGVAAYRFSELVGTLGYLRADQDAVLQTGSSQEYDNKKNKFNIPNAGYVRSRRPRNGGWSRINWAVTMNRRSDLNESLRYQGEFNGSITDRWLFTASDGFADDAFGDQLALSAGAIFLEEIDGEEFFTSHVAVEDILTQEQRIERSGSLSEVSFSFGGNYKEKWLLGAQISASNSDYEERKTLSETDPQDRVRQFNELIYDETLNISASGINFKLGAVYMPSIKSRIGGYIHTPSFMQVEDAFETGLLYSFQDDSDNTVTNTPNDVDLGVISYNIITPWTFGLDAAYIFGSRGFISADVSFLNYAGNSFDFTSIDDTPENQEFERTLNDEVDAQLGSAINLRVGGELALGQDFRLRAGAAFLGAPYDDEASRKQYSLGLGYRIQRFFVDAALRYEVADDFYNPYDAGDIGITPVVEIDRRRQQFYLSFGYKI